MVKRGTLASAGGPRPSTETGIARAETLWPDGGQRIWKPGPDAAAGPTGAQESAAILFPSASMHSGNVGGARGGGPRGMGEEGGRPGAETRHATQPPAGAPAGQTTHTWIRQGSTRNRDRGRRQNENLLKDPTKDAGVRRWEDRNEKTRARARRRGLWLRNTVYGTSEAALARARA